MCLKNLTPVIFSNNSNKSSPVSVIFGTEICHLIFTYETCYFVIHVKNENQLRSFHQIVVHHNRSTKYNINHKIFTNLTLKY